MTEDEAKTKWCPQAKGQYPSQTYCIASECMMWEWDMEFGEPTGAIQRKEKSTVNGYCGLSGQPKRRG